MAHAFNPQQTHAHTHGVTDPVLFTSQRGIWAIKQSLLGLLATALLQSVVVLFSGSVALPADTLHNASDVSLHRDISQRAFRQLVFWRVIPYY